MTSATTTAQDPQIQTPSQKFPILCVTISVHPNRCQIHLQSIDIECLLSLIRNVDTSIKKLKNLLILSKYHGEIIHDMLKT